MYTRTRQTPGYANVRNQSTPNIGYQGQNACNQPGGFQGTQPSSNQQSNYNQGSVRSPQTFKPQQPQPQQQSQMQQVAARSLQQGKPQQSQMQLPPPRNLQQGTSHQMQQQQLLQQIKQAQQPIINSSQIQPQSHPQPQLQLQPQPQSQTQPQLQLQPQPQLQLQPQPQPQPQPQSQPQPQLQSQPQPQPQSQSQSQLQSQTQTQVQPQPQPQPQIQTQTPTQTQPQPQPQPQPQSQPQPQPQPQLQPQPQPQLQPQPQPQPQPQLQSQSQPQSQSQLQPQRLKPILKQPTHIQQQSAVTVQNNPISSPQTLVSVPTSPLTANSNPTPPISKTVSEGKNENQVSENADAEVQEQHPRWRRKAPGFRVNKRIKRLRLNQRLKKTLQPKNAIMVLNEMKPGVQFTFPETQGPMSNSLYLVHAELDGKTYVGQGLSKPLARQNAAENALKALLLEKMTAASMKARIDAESDGQANQSSESSNVAKEDNNEEAVTPMDVSIDESDEIPWSSLASFALYKLFLEWHNQGTSVPVPRPGLPSPTKGMKREISHVQKTPVQKELPPNATNIHPVMLLNQMRPGLTYVELNRVGNPPNTMFTLAVDIDDVEYTGTAKNKKDAKKIAAKSALLALYGLNYPDEVKPVSQDQAVA